MQKLVGVVLAGGRSSRMGQDKALLPLGDETFLSLAVAQLEPFCEKVWVNGRYSGFDCIQDLAEAPPFQGPLAGIYASVKTLLTAAQSYGVLILPVDMPALSCAPIEQLTLAAEHSPDKPIAFENSLFPLYLPLTQSTLMAIEQLMKSEDRKQRSIRALLEELDANMLSYESLSELKNINTPEQYLALRNQ